MRHESLTFEGCAPTPLASYLKALGILRLISSDANHVSGRAADPEARGWWEKERFHLRTTLDRDALYQFYLNDYAPSPIIAPWNGGSGFYPKDNKDGFEPLTSETVAERFKPLAEAIRIGSSAIAHQALTERPEGGAKVELAVALRAELPDSALDWIDAVLALSGDRLAYPQLLGTGGNDGRLDCHQQFHAPPCLEDPPLGDIRCRLGQALGRREIASGQCPFRLVFEGIQFCGDRPVRPRCGGWAECDRGLRSRRQRQSLGLCSHAGRSGRLRRRGDAPPPSYGRVGSELPFHGKPHSRRRVGAASEPQTKMMPGRNSGHPSGGNPHAFARSTPCSPRDAPS